MFGQTHKWQQKEPSSTLMLEHKAYYGQTTTNCKGTGHLLAGWVEQNS